MEFELSLMHGCADKGSYVSLKQHLQDCRQALAADLQHLQPESEPITTSRRAQATLDMGRLLGVLAQKQSIPVSYHKRSSPHKT